jgi:hypothetical protein
VPSKVVAEPVHCGVLNGGGGRRLPVGILVVAVGVLLLVSIASLFVLSPDDKGTQTAPVPPSTSGTSRSNGSSTRSVVAGGAIGVSGTLLGTLMAATLAWVRDKRLYREQTAIVVVELENVIWVRGDAGGANLRTALQAATIQLRAGGVDDQLREALARVTLACWWSGQDPSGTNAKGIDATLLSVRRDIERAVVADLLRLGSPQTREKWRQAALQRYQVTPLTFPTEPVYY